jgi:alpha-ribazole phosphatase
MGDPLTQRSTTLHTMPLWLARHALPLIAPGMCYGATDVPADAAATLQAAERLAHGLPTGVTVAWSPLQRCAQLAQALALHRPDLKSVPDPRLQEMDFGDWEGRLWTDIGADAMAAWTADFAHYRPGGGDNVHGFMQRVASAWDALDGTSTLWITHAGVIRAATLLASGVRHIDRADQWPRTAPAFGAWARLEIAEK